MNNQGLRHDSLDYYEKAYRVQEKCGQVLAMSDSMIRQGSVLISMERYDQITCQLGKAE